MKDQLFINQFQETKDEFWIAKFGRKCIETGMFLAKYKPVLTIGLNLGALVLAAVCPAFAQQTMPNPFGSNGTTKLANAGSNVLVILTWLSFFIGLVAFASIAVCIYFEKDYKKNLAVGGVGLGGFLIMGSIAYDIVNLSSMSIDDPKLGH